MASKGEVHVVHLYPPREPQLCTSVVPIQATSMTMAVNRRSSRQTDTPNSRNIHASATWPTAIPAA